MNARLQAPLAQRCATVRAQTLGLATPLSEADCQVLSMPDASPVKWHLAHVTWFFETFVLEPHLPGFRPRDPVFRVLFNSGYNGVGRRHPRAQRGLVTRPDLAAVRAYRAAVDTRMAELLAGPLPAAVASLVQLGLQHEQQHQELILTDLLHLLSCNPLAPVSVPMSRPTSPPLVGDTGPAWITHAGGLVPIGHAGAGLAFDNEGPRHSQHLRPHALARRPVSQGDWAAFIADGAYSDPRWWLSAVWDWVRSQQISAPPHWRRSGNAGRPDWSLFSVRGLLPLQAAAPVAHVSWYEAEWEHAAQAVAGPALAAGNFLESGALRALPAPAAAETTGLLQLFGDVWEWTASPYTPYPGCRAWDGAVGEYNGKFMVNQMVLRGGSCATPSSHIRSSDRNFFPTETRWQFSGLRLARDAG